MVLWKCCTQHVSKFGKLSSGHRTRNGQKVSFHSNPKEGQCQRMFKLLHNCTHLTRQQNNAQNSPSQASTVHELWTSRCSSWIYRKQRNQRSNCQHPRIIKKARVPEKHLLLLYWLRQSLCVDHNKLWEILKEMGIPNHLNCLLRNLYAGQEATVRTRHGAMNWFQTGKGVRQGCILSLWLFYLHEDYIMWNAGLDESQDGIKIAGRNIKNLGYCRWSFWNV